MDALVVTPKQAREMLHIGLADVYKKLESGEIAAYKEKGAWKIPKSLLAKYVEDKAIAESEIREELEETEDV